MISRENHRFLKSLNREQFSKKLYDYYSQAYNEGAYETECAIYRQLADSFGFDNEDIDKLRKGVFGDLEAINQKYVTADEIMNGFFSFYTFQRKKRIQYTMKIYFLSSQPCMLSLNGTFYGTTDSFERFAELNLSDRIFVKFSSSSALITWSYASSVSPEKPE